MMFSLVNVLIEIILAGFMAAYEWMDSFMACLLIILMMIPFNLLLVRIRVYIGRSRRLNIFGYIFTSIMICLCVIINIFIIIKLESISKVRIH